MKPKEYYEGFAYPAGEVRMFLNTRFGLFTMSVNDNTKIVHYEPKDMIAFREWLLAHGAIDVKTLKY